MDTKRKQKKLRKLNTVGIFLSFEGMKCYCNVISLLPQQHFVSITIQQLTSFFGIFFENLNFHFAKTSKTILSIKLNPN
jgi:hypothetical protein